MNELKFETIWFEQRKYEEAESRCHQKACCASGSATASSEAQERQASQQSSIVAQIAKARETIQQTLKGETSQRSEPSDPKDGKRLELLEKETQQLKEVIKNIQQSLSMLEEKVANIEISKGDQTPAVTAVPPVTNTQQETKPSTKPESDDDDDDDDDEDLFGSDNDEEAEKLKEIRLAQYAAKKAKKPAVIAKSNIILDVKPWDDETDMAIVEEKVRSVICDGLLWGKSKLVPVGYGIKKLQIGCVVEDDKVGVDFLEEEITKFEDLVQSVDIAAFNKV